MKLYKIHISVFISKVLFKTLIFHFNIFYGCFHAAMAELNSWKRNYMAWKACNIGNLVLYRKKKPAFPDYKEDTVYNFHTIPILLCDQYMWVNVVYCLHVLNQAIKIHLKRGDFLHFTNVQVKNEVLFQGQRVRVWANISLSSDWACKARFCPLFCTNTRSRQCSQNFQDRFKMEVATILWSEPQIILCQWVISDTWLVFYANSERAPLFSIITLLFATKNQYSIIKSLLFGSLIFAPW